MQKKKKLISKNIQNINFDSYNQRGWWVTTQVSIAQHNQGVNENPKNEPEEFDAN